MLMLNQTFHLMKDQKNLMQFSKSHTLCSLCLCGYQSLRNDTEFIKIKKAFNTFFMCFVGKFLRIISVSELHGKARRDSEPTRQCRYRPDIQPHYLSFIFSSFAATRSVVMQMYFDCSTNLV